MIVYFRRAVNSDSGIGMILVLGITAFVATITATAGMIAINGLGQSRNRINYEKSLAAAEYGVDFALANLQQAFDDSHADYPIPASGIAPSSSCLQTAPNLADFTTVNEKTWATGLLANLAKDHPECVLDTKNGQVVILKPASNTSSTGVQYGRIYARGYSPSRAAPDAVSRTIKIEYVFLPYKPKHAILTGSDLTLQSSSTDVLGAYGVDGKLAAVHTNGNLSTTGQPTVTGPVTRTGSASGNFSNFLNGKADQKPEVRIPKISALAFYKQAPGLDPAAMTKWVDLCTDGSARQWSSAGPCQGTSLGTSPFQGWSYSSSETKWTASKDTTSGTYFVNKADVANGNGNGAIANLSVIASASTTSCTGKQFGNIVWDHYDTPTPAFKNLFFFADGDLSARSNFYSGQSSATNVISGMYIAGEEVLVWTSSSGLVGAILAGNQCPSDTGPVTANEVQGQIVKFDPNGDSPFSSLIATTLWLEY